MLLSEKILPSDLFRHRKGEDGVRRCLPENLYLHAGRMVPWFAAAAAVFSAIGLYVGLFAALGDPPIGDVYRIAFIHAPASWMSMLIYLAMTLCAAAGRWVDAPVAAMATMAARALAPTGAMFTFLGLWSGCMWTRPVLGTWWAGDLELYSELMLLWSYGGVIALHISLENPRHANRASIPVTLAGFAWVPVNFASVQTWSVEHLSTTAGLAGTPGLASATRAGMLAMSLGFLTYAAAMVLVRLRCVLLEHERESDWVARLGGKSP